MTATSDRLVSFHLHHFVQPKAVAVGLSGGGLALRESSLLMGEYISILLFEKGLRNDGFKQIDYSTLPLLPWRGQGTPSKDSLLQPSD